TSFFMFSSKFKEPKKDMSKKDISIICLPLFTLNSEKTIRQGLQRTVYPAKQIKAADRRLALIP
ncbi:MAG TPA: hypothetical protein P5523_09540, partial [Bacteroidales bacterium]|nr:hypothetical protein [Bacteroidales bacterium]